jgi:hypothetical protein
VRRYTTSTELEFDTPRSRQRADVSHALCNLLFLMRYEVMGIIDTAKVTSAELHRNIETYWDIAQWSP